VTRHVWVECNIGIQVKKVTRTGCRMDEKVRRPFFGCRQSLRRDRETCEVLTVAATRRCDKGGDNVTWNRRDGPGAAL
jgi:hypothetical protein